MKIVSYSKFKLYSKIRIDAKLTMTQDRLREEIAFFPYMKPLKSRRELAYSIEMAGASDHSYFIDFKEDCIEFLIFSESTPQFFLRDAIVKVILILSNMKLVYSIDYSALLPYIRQALSAEQISEARKIACRSSNCNRDLDLAFSKRIIELKKQNAAAKESLLLSNKKVAKLFSEFIIQKSGSRFSLDSAAKDNNLDEGELNEAIAYLESRGYKISKHENNLISLVKV